MDNRRREAHAYEHQKALRKPKGEETVAEIIDFEETQQKTTFNSYVQRKTKKVS